MKKRLIPFGGILAIALMLLLLAKNSFGDLAPSFRSSADKTLTQFTSQGHVLGFAQNGLLVSNATYALHVEFVGANRVTPFSATNGARQNSAPPLTRVTYPNLWDGITLAYDAPTGSIMRSTYTLAPSAPVENIQLHYNAPVSVNADGSLSIEYATGKARESAPIAWQEINGERKAVEVAFATRGEHQVGFIVGAHDPNVALVIDPLLTWNTFLGGSDNDGGWGMALDGNGSTYVTGYSASTWGTPVRAFSGEYDAFVAKLDANGALVWNTFLGGTAGDTAIGIVADANGNLYVAGASYAAWGTPIRAYTFDYDGFVAKLDANGALVWNTFLGGDSWDMAYGVGQDDEGNVYSAGYSGGTWGSPARPFTDWEDAFVAKINSDGTLVWNSFLGGSDTDVGNGLAVQGNGNVYVSGVSYATWGTPIRGFTGLPDAFVAKVAPDGTLMWNTFLGGVDSDAGYGVAIDATGNVYVTGFSSESWSASVRPFTQGEVTKRGSAEKQSDDAAVAPAPIESDHARPARARETTVNIDAFVTKLDTNGALLWNTFLGGSSVDGGIGIAVDSSNSVYVGGYSYGTWGAPQRRYIAGEDGFAAKLDSNGALVWNTFLGSGSGDASTGIALDASGFVHVRGNSTSEWGFPLNKHHGKLDVFAVKLPTAPDCNQKPEKPALLSPRNNKAVKVSAVKLNWSDAPCADTYQVTVREGSTSGRIILQKTNLDVSEASLKGLQDGKSYYWSVQAANDVGKSKSGWSKFLVRFNNTHLYIDNRTGGTLCYEALSSGVGRKCFGAGISFYGTFPAGSYKWKATAPCGSDSGSIYYPPGSQVHWFSCDSASLVATLSPAKASTLPPP